jgi:chromosome segregation ATPase
VKDDMDVIPTGLSITSLVAVLVGMVKGARSYGHLERAQEDLEDRVERCETTHHSAGEKLDATTAALNKMSGTLEQVCKSVERVHARLDEL